MGFADFVSEENSLPALVGGFCCLCGYTLCAITFHYQYAIAQSCGQSCGMVLFVLALLPAFFGGVTFNFVAWTAIGVLAGKFISCGSETSASMGTLCCLMGIAAFGMFGIIVWLSAPGSFVWQRSELNAVPPLRDASICGGDWHDHRGFIYTTDGSFLSGSASGDAIGANLVTIEHCTWVSKTKSTPGRWETCRVGFAPLSSCSNSRRLDGPPISFATCEKKVCAWAVAYDSIPKMPETCGDAGVGGICGLAGTYRELLPTGSNCAGEDAVLGQSWEEACYRYVNELKAAFSAAALAANLTTGSDVPIFKMRNPTKTINELDLYYSIFVIFLFAYVPLPILLGCCLVGAALSCASFKILPDSQ